jgi:hypothetical protein
MQTKHGMILIGSRRTKVSILCAILVVVAITASLSIWQRGATPVSTPLSTNPHEVRPALDQHERHPILNFLPAQPDRPALDQHERHPEWYGIKAEPPTLLDTLDHYAVAGYRWLADRLSNSSG